MEGLGAAVLFLGLFMMMIISKEHDFGNRNELWFLAAISFSAFGTEFLSRMIFRERELKRLGNWSY
jgi:hypothetical protein